MNLARELEQEANDTQMSENVFIDKINTIDELLYNNYKSIISTETALSRQVVSFQANKLRPSYRWYKYKEGFSAELVHKYIHEHELKKTKKILDPFAGSGTTLFAASELGIDSIGIELLPIGQEIIKTRNILQYEFTDDDFNRLEYWEKNKPWNLSKSSSDYSILRITSGAYPVETENCIKKYLFTIQNENDKVKSVLFFALLCVLENISYTRKDGQYLRWDYRSGRRIGSKPFDKGEIKPFDSEIIQKIDEILSDTKYFNNDSLFNYNDQPSPHGVIETVAGSCLNELPKFNDCSFDLVITSPPYCNRYDYTRTYALELAMIGSTEEELASLRQSMLSCTVENREKDLLKINPNWSLPLNIVENHDLLQSILKYLEFKKTNKTLNNNGLPRMIKGYFYEMACVVFELFRVLSSDGQVIMVNDNVRYAGASISVDLILSDIAKNIGFQIEKISVLPQNKGNSSQQMGLHGRDALRKCVYIWRKN